nr:MAG TPA: ASCH domain protein [Bacteriophage sp.]
MKEKPIIFSADMVKTILDGKKMMTRRVVKSDFINNYKHAHIIKQSSDKSREGKAYFYDKPVGGMVLSSQLVSNPYGKVGDHLWVRETWIQGYNDPLIESEGDDENAVSIIYKADGKEEYRSCSAETAENWGDFSADSEMVGFKSPIHMPRWASRILLEITDIRVERLNDISEADCEKEGFRFYPLSRICFKPCSTKHPSGHGSNNYKSIFGEYWDTLNAKKGYQWSSNPWVWVIEFKKVQDDKPSD